MIAAAGCAADLTGGSALGGSGTTASAAEARALRLAKFGAAEPHPMEEESTPPSANEDSTKPAPTAETSTAANDDVEMKEATTSSDPIAGLDQEALTTLTESMGFALLRAQKGILYGNGSTVESAVEWIMQHQEDDDIDDVLLEESDPAAVHFSEGGPWFKNYEDVDFADEWCKEEMKAMYERWTSLRVTIERHNLP